MRTKGTNSASVNTVSGIIISCLIGLNETKNRMLVSLADLFSTIEGEKVTPQQALRLLNLMASFTCVLLGGGSHICVLILLLCWFGVSVLSLQWEG